MTLNQVEKNIVDTRVCYVVKRLDGGYEHIELNFLKAADADHEFHNNLAKFYRYKTAIVSAIGYNKYAQCIEVWAHEREPRKTA